MLVPIGIVAFYLSIITRFRALLLQEGLKRIVLLYLIVSPCCWKLEI